MGNNKNSQPENQNNNSAVNHTKNTIGKLQVFLISLTGIIILLLTQIGVVKEKYDEVFGDKQVKYYISHKSQIPKYQERIDVNLEGRSQTISVLVEIFNNGDIYIDNTKYAKWLPFEELIASYEFSLITQAHAGILEDIGKVVEKTEGQEKDVIRVPKIILKAEVKEIRRTEVDLGEGIIERKSEFENGNTEITTINSRTGEILNRKVSEKETDPQMRECRVPNKGRGPVCGVESYVTKKSAGCGINNKESLVNLGYLEGHKHKFCVSKGFSTTDGNDSCLTYSECSHQSFGIKEYKYCANEAFGTKIVMCDSTEYSDWLATFNL